jgi:hypothetical protein
LKVQRLKVRRFFTPLLALVTSGIGCDRIIGAEFNDLGPAPSCEGCAGRPGADGGNAGTGTGGPAGGEGALGGAAGVGGGAAGVGAGGRGQGGGSATGGVDGGKSGEAGRAGAGTTSGGAAGDEGGASGAGGDDSGSCTTNAECLDRHVGEAYVCRDRACVPVTTEDCSIVLPSGNALKLLRARSPVLVGAFTAHSQALTYQDHKVVNWDLAFSEFESATLGGLAGGDRPLVLVVCDGLDDHLIPNLRHLTLNLGVTGVLSSLPANKLLAAFQHTRSDEYRAAGGQDVFFLAGGSATETLADFQDDGLIWHMLGHPRQIAEATAALVRRVEPFVREQRELNFEATGVDSPAFPLRLTLVAADSASSTETANILTAGDLERPETNLVINNQLAILQDAFRRFDSESQLTHPVPDAGVVAEEILTHPPNIVVATGTAEFAATMSLVESYWGARAPGFMRPYYVLGPGLYNTTSLLDTLWTSGSSEPPLHERVLGVNFAEATALRARSLYSSYLLRLTSFYESGELENTLSGWENYYDVAYLMLYSYAAAGAADSHVTAAELREAFTNRVISENVEAESVDIGPSNVPMVLELLESPRNLLSLYGTMGEPTFDRSTGVRLVPISAWCAELTDDGPYYVADGLRYDRALGLFVEPPTGPPACLDQY